MRFFYPWGGSAAPSNTAVNYNTVYAGGNSTWSTVESARDTIVASPFTIDKLYVALDAAPGAGTQYVFTLRKNGADTAQVVTITGTGLSAIDVNQAISFAPGDSIALSCTPTGTPAAPTNCYGYLEGYAGDNSFPILGGTNNAISNTAVNFQSPLAGRSSWQTADTLANQIVPVAGTLKNLRVRLGATPGVGKSIAITIYKNGSPTSLTTTIADNATTGTDSTDTVSFAPGDTMSIATAPTNTPSTPYVRWALEFAPATNGQSFIAYSSTSVGSVNTPFFDQPESGGSWNAAENLRQSPVPATTFQNIYALIGAAPGGAASRTFTARLNAGDTALATTITGAGTTGSATNTTTSNAGDLMSFKMTPTGTPAAMTNGARVSVGVYYAPSTNNGAGFFGLV